MQVQNGRNVEQKGQQEKGRLPPETGTGGNVNVNELGAAQQSHRIRAERAHRTPELSQRRSIAMRGDVPDPESLEQTVLLINPNDGRNPAARIERGAEHQNSRLQSGFLHVG